MAITVSCCFIETDSDLDDVDVPFYELGDKLAPRIYSALKTVFDGTNCPFFCHVDLGGSGFIAACSQEISEGDLKKAYYDWLDEGGEESKVDIETDEK